MVKLIFQRFLRFLGPLFDFLRETVNTSQGRLRGLKIGCRSTVARPTNPDPPITATVLIIDLPLLYRPMGAVR